MKYSKDARLNNGLAPYATVGDLITLAQNLSDSDNEIDDSDAVLEAARRLGLTGTETAWVKDFDAGIAGLVEQLLDARKEEYLMNLRMEKDNKNARN